MLFELYSVPRVTYAIDALMSFAHNHASTPSEVRDGLTVSFNTASTHVIPILNGKVILSRTKRYGSIASIWILSLSTIILGYLLGVVKPHNFSSNSYS